MEIVNRKSAAERGMTTFFTGKACKSGHVAARYVSTGHCVECVKMAARAYRGSLAPAPRLPTLSDLAAGGTHEQHAARIERDAADDLSEKLAALDRAHVAAVARLSADLTLAKDNAKASSARAVRVALAALDDAMVSLQTQQVARAERDEAAAQQQAERDAIAARVAARDEFKRDLRKCRAKVAPEHVETADAYVWAVATMRCADILQEDVCRGADKEYAGVRGYLVHPNDVAATMKGLKAYAPPISIVAPVAVPEAASSSSDWLHQ